VGEMMVKKELIRIARKLRKDSTEAERRLWSKLRGKQLAGFKFRRQQPVGPHVVDFINFEKRLIIEIDGGHHALQKERDNERDCWLEEKGFEVLRYWNNEIIDNIDGVLEAILKKLTSPSPNPSHKGRGFP
jgi:very-short-patch-repair endonuclease